MSKETISKLEEIVRHYNGKWPTGVDRLYYWYRGCYMTRPPQSGVLSYSYSKDEFESLAEKLRLTGSL